MFLVQLTLTESMILLGLLEDIAQEDDVNEAYPIQTRIVIKDVIQKLGGTYFGKMVTCKNNNCDEKAVKRNA